MQDDIVDLGDLAPQEVKLTSTGKNFILREASASSAGKYQDSLTASQEFTKDAGFERIRASGYSEAEITLVSECLFHADDKFDLKRMPDGSPHPSSLVPRSVIAGWPDPKVQKILERLKKISNIGQLDEPEVIKSKIAILQKQLARAEAGSKNGSVGTTATSALPTV